MVLQRKVKKVDETKTEMLRIRVSQEDKILIRLAARAAHLPTATWARMVLVDAATRWPPPHSKDLESGILDKLVGDLLPPTLDNI